MCRVQDVGGFGGSGLVAGCLERPWGLPVTIVCCILQAYTSELPRVFNLFLVGFGVVGLRRTDRASENRSDARF